MTQHDNGWQTTRFSQPSSSPTHGQGGPLKPPMLPQSHFQGHTRNQSSSSSHANVISTLARTNSHRRSQSAVNGNSSGTFAPGFIKADASQGGLARVDRIEGENDFSGKKYVWVRNSEDSFVQGWIAEERAGNTFIVQCEDGSQHEIVAQNLDRVNPAKFDKASDMAELTHLNEPSVVHNLQSRYTCLLYTSPSPRD